MWECGGCLESVQQDVFTKCGLLECHVIGTCELWARTQGTGIISMNARGRFAARSCNFGRGAECMCQCSCKISR